MSTQTDSDVKSQDPFNAHRERGILTVDDRLYILGEKDSTDQAKDLAATRLQERLNRLPKEFMLLRESYNPQLPVSIVHGAEHEYDENHPITYLIEYAVNTILYNRGLLYASELETARFNSDMKPRDMTSTSAFQDINTAVESGQTLNEPPHPTEIPESHIESKQGVLTEEDRNFLYETGEATSEMKHASDRIQERLRNAVLDIELLVRTNTYAYPDANAFEYGDKYGQAVGYVLEYAVMAYQYSGIDTDLITLINDAINTAPEPVRDLTYEGNGVDEFVGDYEPDTSLINSVEETEVTVESPIEQDEQANTTNTAQNSDGNTTDQTERSENEQPGDKLSTDAVHRTDERTDVFSFTAGFVTGSVMLYVIHRVLRSGGDRDES